MTLLKSKSFLTVFFLTVLIVFCFFKNPRQKGTKYFAHELQWDVFSYYMYLPFTFIYNDVAMKDRSVVEDIFKKYNLPGTYYQAYQLDNGNYTPNYTMGFALLWSPFFFIGHGWAKAAGYPTDGWSLPYQFSISVGVLLYMLLGLFFLRKTLLELFSDRLTALILLLIVLGTNYFHETINDFMQPHAQVFTGYCILLYCTIRWHRVQKKKYMMIAGFVMGIMTLARPSEILCVLIPLLWNVYNKESLQIKIGLIRTHFPQIILLVVFAFLPFIPQMIYWKYITGSWIFFSYQHTEGFDFLQPHIFKVLFSFKKSWLIYTPIIIFPIIGILLLKKYNRPIFPAVIVFFLANFYLLSSWAAWWNGGSFGMRYFVESYPVMAIPFGYMLSDISKRKWFIKMPLFILIFAFVLLNLFQTWQYVYSIIPEDRMTSAYYKAIFLKTKVTDEERKLMEVERSYIYAPEKFTNPEAYDHRLAGYFDFDQLNSGLVDTSKLDSTYHLSGTFSYKMPATEEWGPLHKLQYDQLVPGNRDHAWLKVTVNYFTEEDIKNNPASLVITMPHKKYNLKYRSIDFEKFPFRKGEWNKVEYDYMTPYPLFTKTGYHWSVFGASLAQDSILSYIQHIYGEPIPSYTRKGVEWTDKARWPDADFERPMNLYFSLQDHSYVYPKLEMVQSTLTRHRPKVIIISDSFFSMIKDLQNLQFIFSADSKFWYYFNKSILMTDKNETAMKSLDVISELESADFVILLGSQGTLGDFPYGFADYFSDNASKTGIIGRLRECIKNDAQWMKNIAGRSNAAIMTKEQMAAAEAKHVFNTRNIIHVKAANNKFVSADVKKGNILIADRDSAWLWETFSFVHLEKDKCAIYSFENKFIATELGRNTELTATRDAIAGWETFSISYLDSGYVSLKAVNGKYLSLDEKSKQLFATGNSVGQMQKFRLIPAQ